MRVNAIRHLLFVSALALVQLSGPSAVDAQSDTPRLTGLQSNGIDCIARDPTVSMWRSSGGLKNTNSSSILVFCPIADASDDSSAELLFIRDVELHYAGATAPTTCNVVVRGSSGSVGLSPNLVAGTSTTSGTPVMKLTAPWRVSAGVGANAALGIRCTLPPGVTIVGSTARREHHRIEGGI